MRARGERERFLDVFVGRLGALAVHLEVVDVGPVRQRDTPERHRGARVEGRGALELADRLAVIEAVGQRQPLVEQPLRLRAEHRMIVELAVHAADQIEPGAKRAKPLTLATTLRQPTGVVFDPIGQQLFVVDTAAHQVVAIGLDGQERARFGRRGDGNGEFNFPTLIGRDHDGRLYVTDSLNFRIQLFDAQGRFISRFGRLGNATGDLSRPKGVATDRFGHVYVIDSMFHVLQIFDRNGVFLLDIGGQGQAAGEFWLPTGLYVGDNDTIYIADSHNQRVQVMRYIGGQP